MIARRGGTRVARRAASLLLLGLGGCTPPIRQFDLKQQPLTCEHANAYTYDTLRTMGFTLTAFEPAAPARPGTIRGTRENRGTTQNVTVTITCSGNAANIDASEDGRWLGQLEFKRGFYLSFKATAAEAATAATAAQEESQRPPEQKKTKGLQVRLEPVPGLGAKLDFNLDLAAAGVLPVRVSISNVSPRTYRFDPSDIVMIQQDGARVRPLTITAAVQRVVDAEHQKPAGGDTPPVNDAEITSRLQERLLQSRAVPANQSVHGYLFYPAAAYTKGRVSLEDEATEESEGFVVEFRDF